MILFVRKVSVFCAKLFLLGLVLSLVGTEIFAQSRCLSEAETRKVIESIKDTSKPKKNKNIRRELLKMQKAQESANEKIFAASGNPDKYVAAFNQVKKENIARLCEIFREAGWLRKESIGKNGLEAVLFIIRNTNQARIQRELFPVITEATQKGYISKANLAALIDKIRINSGQNQIFGTQVKIRDEVGYLYPLENPGTVDKWRKMYDLPPISNFIKIIETRYRTIVVKMPEAPGLRPLKKDLPETLASDDTKLLGLESEDEILTIENRLVNLNVRVLTKDLLGTRGLQLEKEDFLVYENGKKQEISFFSTTDTPFDLVLLLDLSGSTTAKQQLIADSASRFIKLAREKDRIAIVTFSDYTRIISEFTNDKDKLLSQVDKINDYGSSKVWDALEYTYEKIIKKQEEGRRSAVVFMTDGVDNSLVQDPFRPASGSFFYSSRPSKITFTDLLETVRENDANIFSIYLDTEGSAAGRYTDAKSFRQARRTLKMLSEESGGQFYRAGMIEDLSGIYEKIINDLSEVYSLGYEPTEDESKGTWRELNIKIRNRPDLIVKSKRGYYAK